MSNLVVPILRAMVTILARMLILSNSGPQDAKEMLHARNVAEKEASTDRDATGACNQCPCVQAQPSFSDLVEKAAIPTLQTTADTQQQAPTNIAEIASDTSTQRPEISTDQLKKIFTGKNATSNEIDGIVKEINDSMEKGNINNRERLIHFMAQIREEAGSSISTQENLNYKVSALSLFGYYKNNPEMAKNMVEQRHKKLIRRKSRTMHTLTRIIHREADFRLATVA